MLFLKLFRSDVIGGPIGVLLAGAAVVSVALPMTKRLVRPFARKAIRSAYSLVDSVQETRDELEAEWNSLLAEARMDTEEVGIGSGAIAQAWREEDDQEDPTRGQPYA